MLGTFWLLVCYGCWSEQMGCDEDKKESKMLVAALMFEAAMKCDEKKKCSLTPSKHMLLLHHTATITFEH